MTEQNTAPNGHAGARSPALTSEAFIGIVSLLIDAAILVVLLVRP